MASKTSARFSGGWWPYIVPYFAFLFVVELSTYLGPGSAFSVLLLKLAVPAMLLFFFFARGAYPELRAGDFRPLRTLADLVVGIASACLWVAPYIVLPSLRPGSDAAFDPQMAGPELAEWVLVLRFVGFVIVTPVFEELFIRSFVMRYAEAMREPSDFREIPIGRYSLPGFIATVVVFTITHVPWEYWVAVPWIVLTNLYFYWRRDLWALILVHASANASIFLFAIFAATSFGMLPSLWFFL